MSTVVLTRPQGKNEELAQALALHGHTVLKLPALEIQALTTVLPKQYDPVNFDLLIFVSAQAAMMYMAALKAASLSFPTGTNIATVGAASAAPFYAAALSESLTLIHPPASHPLQDSEALWELLYPQLQRYKRVLIVRGQQGREWLSEQLAAHEKTVTRCSIYERVAAQWPTQDAIQLQNHLVKPQSVVFLLTSSESTQAIYDNMQRLQLLSAWKQARFVAIHPRIAHCVQALSSLSPDQATAQIRICAPSQPAMLEALLQSASY